MIGKSIQELTSQFAQGGTVQLVTIRRERKQLPVSIEEVEALAEIGLEGDHYASKGGKRQVTLIAQEHINGVASMLGVESVDPLLLRRNIVTSGINLHALKDKSFQIGEAILEYTGECHPCSRMEENLGMGGYNAMRGHGGITCRVVQSGRIAGGDTIIPLP
jgi:MOSC domain-containing protein YiiM